MAHGDSDGDDGGDGFAELGAVAQGGWELA